jgi:6-phosphogluconolactonase
MARSAFLDACAAPDTVHMIPTALASADDAARIYQNKLDAFAREYRADQPLFDLMLLGVGPDGHTASLFPGLPAVKETERLVVGVDEANVAPFVPRVSLTLPALAQTREILFLATGQDKRAILRRVFAGEDLPASHAHAADGDTLWLIDKAADPDAAA